MTKKISDLIETNYFTLLNNGEENKEIGSVFCCDLLSIVMAKASMDCVWVTIMANINSLAVASLVDMSCIVFAEGIMPDELTINKAKEQGITIFYSEKPIFECALLIDGFRKS